jgi:hypothetical protein
MPRDLVENQESGPGSTDEDTIDCPAMATSSAWPSDRSTFVEYVWQVVN